jgi:hypothetical protein
MEDPKKPNHAMAAAHYGLTELAGEGTSYDRHPRERELVQVTVTRRKQQNRAR